AEMTRFSTELKAYAGRWIALGEDRVVVSAGDAEQSVRRRAEAARPDENLSILWVSPSAPYVAMPAWPLSMIRRVAADRCIWLAGGPVRDLLLGRPPQDWDFVVVQDGLALARKVANTLGGAYYPLDAKRGTGRVIIRRSQPNAYRYQPLSLLREDEGLRKRKEVTLDFAELRAPDIRADLAARDFTVNAMALTLEGRLIDPTGGEADLAAGRLRLTHPDAFRDDPARLLRAIRQTHQFALEITPDTRDQLQDDARLITEVAPERVRDELVKLMTHATVSQALQDMKTLGLLPYVLPALAHLAAEPSTSPQSYPTGWDHIRATVTTTVEALYWLSDRPLPTAEPTSPAWMWNALTTELACQREPLQAYMDAAVSGLTRADLLPWAALMDSIPESVEDQMKALRFSNRAIRFVKLVLAGPEIFEELVANPLTGVASHARTVTRRDTYRYFQATGDAGVGAILLALMGTAAKRVRLPSREAWEHRLKVAHALLTSYFQHHEEVIEPKPLLGGHALLRMGVPSGPEIGRILAELTEEQAAGEITTEVEARAHVRRLLSQTASDGRGTTL
ncbi:MAG: DUF5678 domain-containing protein, partial [Anaerolineae bacterium]